jgi:hypothetical protein
MIATLFLSKALPVTDIMEATTASTRALRSHLLALLLGMRYRVADGSDAARVADRSQALVPLHTPHSSSWLWQQMP